MYYTIIHLAFWTLFKINLCINKVDLGGQFPIVSYELIQDTIIS